MSYTGFIRYIRVCYANQEKITTGSRPLCLHQIGLANVSVLQKDGPAREEEKKERNKTGRILSRFAYFTPLGAFRNFFFFSVETKRASYVEGGRLVLGRRSKLPHAWPGLAWPGVHIGPV